MRYLSFVLKAFLFLALFGFATNNSKGVTLHYYLGYQWEAPLVLILLLFFALGTMLGLVASLSYIFKLRREILSLKRELRVKSPAFLSEGKAE